MVKPLDEMNGSFADPAHQLALLKEAHTFSRQKLDTTSVLLTRLGTNPPGPAMSALADAGAMGGPFLSVPEQTQREAEIADGMESVHATLEQESRVRGAVAVCHWLNPWRRSPEFPVPLVTARIPCGFRWPSMAALILKRIYAEPVLATSNGQVTWAGPHGPYGNLVEIFHDNGVSTRYGHLKSVNVSLGQKISRGDLIGWMGSTGRSTGPHLHYETRVNGRVIDPQNFWRTQNDLQALENLN